MNSNKNIIKGIKLIKCLSYGVNIEDDPTYGKWKLFATFFPPEFMKLAFIGLFGENEEVYIRSKTKEALEEFVRLNDLKSHPRLINLEIFIDK